MHIPQLTLSTLYADSTTDIINSLHEELKSEKKSFSLSMLRENCVSQLHVCTLYQSNISFNLPPPRVYPRHLTPLPSRGGGNLIISQPFKLLASQLHVNNQSVSLSVQKPFKQLA